VNKASGLAVALQELALSACNVVACGDGENDHALLDSAEYSVATANAIATLRERADRVTIEPGGDGVLEVIADLIEHDLVKSPPVRARRVVTLGADVRGNAFTLPAAGVSMLVTGGRSSGKSAFVIRLLERLADRGYQYCVIDTRGEYLDFNPAVVFGTPDHAPDATEVLTALEKPGVHAVVCLLAVAGAARREFVAGLLRRIVALRESTGRPHWIVVDEAQEARAGEALAGKPAQNTIHVSGDPQGVDPEALAGVDIAVGRGKDARACLDAFARALGAPPPPEPLRAPETGEALVWFRRGGDAPMLIRLPDRDASRRKEREEVGRLLRRA
jgi:hypothetical protein